MYHILLFISLYTLPNKSLTWSMFRGHPDSIEIARGYRASTYTEWALVDSFDNGKAWFTVQSIFVEEKSWTTTDCPVALSHETIHYFISEIWAAKCRERLSKYQGCSEKQLKKAHDIYQHCWKESRKLQALFDRECRHGLNLGMEKIWERNINQDIAKL